MSTQPQLSPIEQLMGPEPTPSQPTQQQTANGGNDLSPIEQLMQSTSQPQQNSPQQTGEITNDVGQKVIVPKEGEAFADTLKRAVAHHNSMTPEQQQAALNAEEKTIPTKAAQTLGAAAATGVAGPALLAVPGEIGELAIRHLAGNVLPGMETEAAKQTLLKAIPTVQTLLKWGLGSVGLKYLADALNKGHGNK